MVPGAVGDLINRRRFRGDYKSVLTGLRSVSWVLTRFYGGFRGFQGISRSSQQVSDIFGA